MNEFDLIRDVFQREAAASLDHSCILCGIGDDAAVIQPPAKQQLVNCTDTLISGRHFPESTDAFSIGYKSVAVNLSDIAAMGAKPQSILLALSLPQTFKDNTGWLTEFARGLFACCNQFGVHLIGGDTTKSDNLTITVTALGFAEKCVYRTGAQVGDVIAVTGTLGDAAFALQDILSGKELSGSNLSSRKLASSKLTGNASALQQRLNQPTPRVALGQQLNGIATSMIDISDGLLQDLGHICTASGVGARLDLDKLPTHQALGALSLDKRLALQLSGGDDYELLFTLPSQHELPQTDVPITVIGEIVHSETLYPEIVRSKIDGERISLYHHNTPYPYTQQGYQHF